MDKKTNNPIIGTQRIKNTTYVFEDISYWDAEKRQNRHKRNYIGKQNEEGTLIPNKAYAARLQLETALKESKKEVVATRKYWGASHLLDVIGTRTGVVEDLKNCFPDSAMKILSLAWYLILESDSPMYRFKKWERTHTNPLGAEFPSQRISELFASITEDAKMRFFRYQSKRRLEREYLAYDTTSISSYSELIDQVRYGHNKDGDPLPQVNLALVFGENSGLPVYYRKLPGNISDVKTVRKLLKDVEFLEFSKVKLVMDRGFYSVKNINALYRSHYKFLVGARCNTVFVSRCLEKVRETLKDFKNYSIEHDVYCMSSVEKWSYADSEDKTQDKDETRRIYVHTYYNGQRAEEEKATFVKALVNAERALLNGTANEEQKILGERYFVMKQTPVLGIQIECDEEAVKKRLNKCGYFVLLSNEIRDAKIALEIYRNKDLVEKAFCNLKNRLDLKRTAVSSSENLEGKLFVQFVALIFMSYLHKGMKEKDMHKSYSMQSLLDELDVIEYFEYPGSRGHYSEITEKQLKIFAAFNVEPPNTL